MGKDIEVLGDDAVAEAPEANENVTPEVVTEVKKKGKSKKSTVVDESAELKALRAELADKNSQIEVLGSLTKTKTRGEVTKEVETSCGTIRFYDMKE